MSINELTIGQLKEIQSLLGNNTSGKPHPFVGRYCIIRCYGAGVHAGVVESVDGQHVMLSQACRIWKWEGAFTLSGVAKHGITGGRIAGPLDSIALLDAIEIIPATQKCRESLEACYE